MKLTIDLNCVPLKYPTILCFLFFHVLLLTPLCVASLDCRGEDTVTQMAGDDTAIEGETMTLNCTFETTDRSPYLFWYKYEERKYPEYMLKSQVFSEGENAEEFEGRFDAHLNVDRKTVPLRIWNVQLSDSAVYYCALRPRVTACALNKSVC